MKGWRRTNWRRLKGHEAATVAMLDGDGRVETIPMGSCRDIAVPRGWRLFRGGKVRSAFVSYLLSIRGDFC